MAQNDFPARARQDADGMARGAGWETMLERLFLARSLNSPNAKFLARWFVIAFCLIVWAAVLIALLG